MTPKEKAYDLFMDMKFYIPYVHNPTEPSEDEVAKQCALIAVEEIIQTYHSPMDDEQIQEWQEVRKEVEKLPA